LYEAHEGIVGGHNAGKATTCKGSMHMGLWWPSLFADAKDYCKHCDVCQQIGKPCQRDELPLFPVTALESFDKWEIDFVGPINPPTSHRCTTLLPLTKYLTRWVEVMPVKDCTTEMNDTLHF
jgi:hypothetical protein